MVNKLAGNRFEAELCDILAANGFWAHNMAQNHAGQPADVIAVRNGHAVLIDCKLCQGKFFSFARVEPNQESAMELWKACGNGGGWFAVKGPDGEIRMISYPHIQSLQEQGFHSSLLNANIRLTDWLERWSLSEARHAD